MRIRARLTAIPALLALGGLSLLTAQTVTVDKTTIALTALYQSSAVSAQLNVSSATANTPYSIFVNSAPATPWLKLNNGQIAVNGIELIKEGIDNVWRARDAFDVGATVIGLRNGRETECKIREQRAEKNNAEDRD